MLIDEVVPDFLCHTIRGDFRLYEYMQSSWCIFFGQTYAFTPICTTDLVKAVRLLPQFEKRNVKLIAMSLSTFEENMEWSNDILHLAHQSQHEQFPFPIIGDTDKVLAKKLGMVKEVYAYPPEVRRCFIIGPDKRLKASIWYNDNVGRNYYEILRVIDSLLITDKFQRQIGTPAEWIPGEKCFVMPSVEEEDLENLFPNVETIAMPSGKHYMRMVNCELEQNECDVGYVKSIF